VQQRNILDCTMSRQTQTVNSAGGQSSSLHLARGQPNISNSVRGSAHLSNSGLQKRANISSQSSASFSNEFLLHLLTFSSSDSKESNRSHLQKQIRELDILEGINIRYRIDGVASFYFSPRRQEGFQTGNATLLLYRLF
jgi:hypothetical protein